MGHLLIIGMALEARFQRLRSKWDMVFAPGGKAALRTLEERPFDVIVADLQMPDVDGAQVLAHVQRHHPDTVRILASSYAAADGTMNAIFVAHQFVPKPFDPAHLENVLDRACELQSSITSEGVRAVVGKIDTLPSAPGVYCALTTRLASPNVGTREVATILEQDVGLCTKLLQLVNSALFRSTREIATIEAAVARLGFETVRTLALTVEVFQTSDSRVSGQTVDSLQRHALLTADIAARLSPDTDLAAQSFTAGMLHDIGKLVLASELPRHIGSALDIARAEERPLYQVEQEKHGVTHADIGAYLLGLWGLPYPVVEAVAHHHSPRQVPHVELDVLASVYVANCLAHELDGDPACWEGTKPEVDTDYLAMLGVLDQLGSWREMATMIGDMHA